MNSRIQTNSTTAKIMKLACPSNQYRFFIQIAVQMDNSSNSLLACYNIDFNVKNIFSIDNDTAVFENLLKTEQWISAKLS